jgi:hypothetical protein
MAMKEMLLITETVTLLVIEIGFSAFERLISY